MSHKSLSWRSAFVAAAYVLAVIVAPLLVAGFNYYNNTLFTCPICACFH